MPQISLFIFKTRHDLLFFAYRLLRSFRWEVLSQLRSAIISVFLSHLLSACISVSICAAFPGQGAQVGLVYRSDDTVQLNAMISYYLLLKVIGEGPAEGTGFV